MDDEKIIQITYKQLDKDPELKKNINSMEELILGKEGVGLLEKLGLTPGKMQKSLDKNDYEDFIDQRNLIAAQKLQEWLDASENSTMERAMETFKKSIKEAEQEMFEKI